MPAAYLETDPSEETLEWLARYGMYDDGSTESDALKKDVNQQWFARYIEHMLQSPASSRQNRISNAHSWFTWLETRGECADEVGSENIYDLVDEMDARDAAHPTIGSRVDTVTVMYLWAEKRGHIGESPFSGFELEEEYENIRRGTPKQVRVLKAQDPNAEAIIAISADQVEKLINNSGTPRLRNQLINRLMWQTGLRTSELASAKIEHIDEENRSITVRSAKADVDDDHYWRTVYYQENLEYQMWEWLHGGGRVALYNGKDVLSEDEGNLLLTQQSSSIRPSHISRIVKQSAKRAGINEVLYVDAAGKKRWLVTGHTLRHSFATFCANGNDGQQTPMPLHTLKRLMGHKSMDTTLRYISDEERVTKRHAERYGPR